MTRVPRHVFRDTCSMTRASRPNLEIVRGALADLARGRAVWSRHGQRGEIKSELTSIVMCHIILIFSQSFHKPDEANIWEAFVNLPLAGRVASEGARIARVAGRGVIFIIYRWIFSLLHIEIFTWCRCCCRAACRRTGPCSPGNRYQNPNISVK